MTQQLNSLLGAGLQDIFMQTFTKVNNDYARIASVVRSTRDMESYAWLGDSPALREFLGEREIKALGGEGFSLVNKTWESTIGIRRETIDDDQYGQIRLRVQNLAYEAAAHRDKLVFGLLNNGTSVLCYDGKPFFASDHQYTGRGAHRAAQSNTGTAELSKQALQSAISGMMSLKRSNGEPGGIVPDTLIVSPSLAWTARELVESAFNPSSSGGPAAYNPLQGTLSLIVSPYITNSKAWFVACCSRPLKPVIFQERQGVEFASLESGSESGFMRNEYLYGISARYNVGPALWQYIFGSFPS